MRKRNIRNKKIKNILSNQRGMALLATLIFVFILVSLSVALLTMTSNDSKLSTLQRDSTRAFYLAETGIEKALWYLNTPVEYGGEDKFEWRPTNYPLINPASNTEYYQFTIIDIGVEDSEATPPTHATDRIEITSVGTVKEGKYSAGKRTVVVTAKIGISPSS
ncbi:MAG: pilus assembly PilX N-terminal domain-containing protein, partial [Actinobacteria bacterium]|nr:pilus assembly PilX N-terminal domain-containing protein [Actinomycetota bacterium]